MLEGPQIPPQEYPSGKEFAYRAVNRKGYFHPEMAASFTFVFNRTTEETFIGTFYQILPSTDIKILETQSFIDAVRGAWRRYRKDEGKRDFVKDKLIKRWEILDGEKLIGKILDLNPESDEIIKEPKKPTP